MRVKKFLMAMGPLVLAMAATPALGQDAGEAESGGTKTTVERETTMPESAMRQATVTVKSVDKKHHKVTFEAQVRPEANVEKNGQPIKLDQLKPGDSVRASFDPSTGQVMKLEVVRKGAQ
jgi:Cu/Ag efflux protein CusF